MYSLSSHVQGAGVLLILYPSVLGKGSLFLMFASSSEGGHLPRRLESLVDSPPVPKKRVVREVRSAMNQGGYCLVTQTVSHFEVIESLLPCPFLCQTSISTDCSVLCVCMCVFVFCLLLMRELY